MEAAPSCRGSRGRRPAASSSTPAPPVCFGRPPLPRPPVAVVDVAQPWRDAAVLTPDAVLPARPTPSASKSSCRRRRQVGSVFLRTLIIDQLIAVPVALVLTSAGGNFLVDAAHRHRVLAADWTVVRADVPVDHPMARRPDAVDRTGRDHGAVLRLRRRRRGDGAPRVSVAVGPGSSASPPFVSWAIGATIALLVGGVMMTMRQLRGKVLTTELEALQARINPHFLFNTLNSIAALIREDPARAENMTLQLSALFRYTLQAPRAGLVTLGEELVIVRGYLAIEQERLGSRLTSEIDVDAALHDQRIPALTLQPLVENAIKHGIATDVAGGSVRVRGWREGDLVHLTVVNTGRGERQPAGIGEGLESVRRRLRATFGGRSSVTLGTVGRRDRSARHVSGEAGMSVRAVIVDDEPLARTRLEAAARRSPGDRGGGRGGRRRGGLPADRRSLARSRVPRRADARPVGLRRAGAAAHPAARDLHHRARRVRGPRLRGTSGRLPAETGRARPARARARSGSPEPTAPAPGSRKSAWRA